VLAAAVHARVFAVGSPENRAEKEQNDSRSARFLEQAGTGDVAGDHSRHARLPPAT
jgi:hypothetical protein